MISSAVLDALTERYGLRVMSHARVDGGFITQNASLFTPDGRWFLKRYRPLPPGRIDRIHAAKHEFAAADISVILPVPASDGSTWFTAEDATYAVFPFIDLPVLDRPIGMTAIESAAYMLARIHTAGMRSTIEGMERRVPHTAAGFVDVAERLLRVAMSRTTAFDALARAALERKLELACGGQWQWTEPSAEGLIHGDFHDLNVYFDDAHSVAHVFDFERVRIAWRGHELIRAIDFVCMDWNPHAPGFLVRSRAFLQAYLRECPMGAEAVWNSVGSYVAHRIHSAWVEEMHYDQDNTRCDHFLELQMEQLRWLPAAWTRIADELASGS